MAKTSSTPEPNLAALPPELLTLIALHLSIPDLKRFRTLCRATSEAVLEQMATLVPPHLTVHGKRPESLRDLANLGETFKMKNAVTRLSLFHLRPDYGDLLAEVKLPGLVWLRVKDGVVREEGLVGFLRGCKGSLREMRVEDVCFVVEGREMREGSTQGWWRVVRVLEGKGFEVRRVVFERVGYCDQEGREESWIVPKIMGRCERGYGEGNPRCEGYMIAEGPLERMFVDEEGCETLSKSRYGGV